MVTKVEIQIIGMIISVYKFSDDEIHILQKFY